MDDDILDTNFSFPPPIPLNEGKDPDPPGQKCELRTYEARYDSKGERLLLHAGVRDGIKPPRARDHDSALVLTRYYDRERELEKTELEIKSPYIKRALRDVIKVYPDVNLYGRDVVIADPPKCLFHYRNGLEAYEATSNDEKARDHLAFLRQYMEQVLSLPLWRYHSNVDWAMDDGAKGLEFQDLWMAYRPKDLFYTTTYGTDSVAKLKSMTQYIPYPWKTTRNWRLCMQRIIYDGERFGYEDFTKIIHAYDGIKPFRDLEVYPFAYHERREEIRQALVGRGRKYAGLRGAHHQEYEGVCEIMSPFVLKTQRSMDDYPLPCFDSVTIKGRVMIDAKAFARTIPAYKEEFDDELELEKRGNEQSDEPCFDDDDFLICGADVPGFALGSKRWGLFKVSCLKDPVFNSDAFGSLILPEDQKKMIHCLVKVHSQKQLKFDDVIKGKGKSMVILLHGAPGTGKTLTAESIADFTKRPLYTISSGELGTDAGTMEENLSAALRLVETWNAVALIDEADIFLEQRSMHDLKRNGLVSVFLRLLEYYEGILFLTTNRIAAFDKAFRSRIHLAIKYSPLSVSARSQLWKLFISNTYPNADLSWVDAKYLAEIGAVNLNGREIKNAFKTAHALAVSSEEEFSKEHIDLALKGVQRFADDLKNEALLENNDASEAELGDHDRSRKRRRIRG